MQKQTFKRVPVRGTTTEELLALWEEGKLYRLVEVEEASEEERLEHCRKEVLEYVSRIDEFAESAWRANIDKVWESVVKHRAFSRSIMMQKGRNRGRMNRYFITALVVWMSNRGVYQSDVSCLRLHLRLERVKKKTSVYTSALNYAPNIQQETILKQLMKSIK